MHRKGASETGLLVNLSCAGLLACAAVLLATGAGVARADPTTFNSAVTLSSGEGVWREQLVIAESGDDPSDAEREREVIAVVSVLAYGINEKLSVFAVVPYVDKELERTTAAAGRRSRGASGLGDVRAFARYTVYRRDWPGALLRVSPFAGVEAPSGDDDERDALGRLPQPLQAGSGSWDAFGGLAASYQSFDLLGSAAFVYEANTEANDFEFGDVARVDASFKYRLLPRRIGPGVPAFLYAGVEMNLIHRGKNEVRGVSDDDSGGTALFVAPAVQYVGKRWVLEGAVQLPAVQDLNGNALESGFVARVGFRINF